MKQLYRNKALRHSLYLMVLFVSCYNNLTVEKEKDLVNWLENLNYAHMQVGQQTNLLNWISFAEWVELIRTQMEMDGESFEIDNPSAFTPEYPGTCNIIFTIETNKGKTKDIIAKELTIAPLTYQPLEVGNIQPQEILPIVWQIESWDKDAYKHIEHLRIAEATRIRDMMWTYGAGNHNIEEYQQLMNRLNVWMLLEHPIWYDNYEIIWGSLSGEPKQHAYYERNILNSLLNHVTFNVVNPRNQNWNDCVFEVVSQNHDKIYIFGQSVYADVDKIHYWYWNNEAVKELLVNNNILLFVAWSNIRTINWILKNKIYHADLEADEHWIYGAPSRANSKNDSIADIHMIATFWTNAYWDIDQTNWIYESSKFPIWFHNDVLFAWREFPTTSLSTWKVTANSWRYPTSFVNYTNVAIASLCFQMFAEVEGIDQLLDMIRSSTNLRDHIRFDLNWDGDTDDICDGQPETQELILMNPAWFIKKYLMPTDSVINAQWWEFYELDKGYYKGIVFDIPGAEVNIGGEWIAYNDNNRSAIISHNPFTLKWRLNGNMLRKHGYRSGDTITGNIIVVDDQWNGLNISTNVIVNIK